jgi:lactose/L-arabinose transport system permease protein
MRHLSWKVGTKVFLLFLSAVFAFPFLWMVFATFKSNLEIFTPFPIFPSSIHIRFYQELLSGQWIPFLTQFWNSLKISTLQTLGALLLSVPTGYIFAQYTFRLKWFFLFLIILSLLIPQQVMVLPLFTWLNTLHLLDTSWSVIFPGVLSGLGVLYFMQVFKQLPPSLLDTCRVEGISEYKILWHLLPLIKPALWTYTLIHFIFAWHEHLLPLVMLSTLENLTVTVSLSSLIGSARIPYAMVMVGGLFTLLPTILLYLILQRDFKSALQDLTSP